jgi:RHS repeat-associated protein
VTVSYTPFDLPKQLKQGASATSFGYDGDQKRIRKTTPTEETLYFEDLYERVIKKAAATTEHRFYIHSPERVTAVVTRGGDTPGTLYLHTDNLGSVDVLTNAKGGIEERRSYDAFGQRRSPIWGQAPPGSFSSKTPKGFTGHEHDVEFGLVNMKGRIFDPKLGRFLTTDPVVPNLFSGQSFNSYAYVLNNPLSYVDPSGFEPEKPPILPIREVHRRDDSGGIHIAFIYPPREGASPVESTLREAEQVGAAASPTDVDTTGSSAGYASQNANFTGADLRGAKVEGATFVGAALNGADFRCEGLERANLKGAQADRSTKWPDGFSPRAHGVVIRETLH